MPDILSWGRLHYHSLIKISTYVKTDMHVLYKRTEVLFWLFSTKVQSGIASGLTHRQPHTLVVTADHASTLAASRT